MKLKKINSMNKTLKEMLIGIVFCGLIFEISGVWFVVDKVAYSVGLLVGILIAMSMVIHMEWVLDTALDGVSEGAENKVRLHSVIRYVLVVLVLAVIMYTGVLNPLASFLGVMSLKVAAYLQPITDRVIHKKKTKSEEKGPS